MKDIVDIGIDFSLNYTALNISNGIDILYYIILRDIPYTKQQRTIFENLNNFKNFKMYLIPKIIKKDDYNLSEINKINDALYIVDIIVKIINNLNIGSIIIEGISFGSIGLRSGDIIGYHYLLRKELLKLTSNLQIYSPKTIKKVAGKGNFSKIEMLNSYLNNNKNDDILNKCLVYEYVCSIQKDIIKKNTVIEPIAGMIDAYWVRKSKNIK